MASAVKFFAKTFFFALFLFLIVGGALGYLLFKSDGEKEVKELIIPRGASLAQVSRVLHENQIIEHPEIFKYLRKRNLTNKRKRPLAKDFQESATGYQVSLVNEFYTDAALC